MKAPKYVRDEARVVVECSVCGCAVTDPSRHTSFHEALARMLGLSDDEED